MSSAGFRPESLSATKSTLRSQRRQIEAVEAENARLDRQIELLSTNRDSLETYARERFYFSKEGEDVYIIED